MTNARRLASRLLFGTACLLLGGALVALLSGYLLPSEGFQDLARFVTAMLLAAVAAIPFLLALLVGRGTGMPAWMRFTSIAGIVIGAIPGVVLLSVRFGA